MRKPLFRYLWGLALCLGMMTATALAVDYDLQISGTQVTDNNADNVLNDGTVAYDPNTNTLTLNNAHLNSASNNIIDSKMEALTINLIGDNTLTATGTDRCISATTADSSITLTGEGTLTADAENAVCIYADRDLTIDSGTYQLSSERGVLQTPNGVLHITGTADVSVTVTKDPGSGNAVHGGGRLQIDGSSTVSVQTKQGAFSGFGQIAGEYAVEIGGSAKVYASAGADTIYAAASNPDSLGILITDDAYIECSTQNYNAIYANSDIQISGNAKIAECRSDASNSIFSDGGDIQISGSADITANGYYGIQAGVWGGPLGNITISDNAKVNSTSTADFGIYATEKMIILDNADVDANGYLVGLDGDAGIKISGGTVDAHAQTQYGITTLGGDITIGGDAVVTASTQTPERYYAIAACDGALTTRDSAHVIAKDQDGNFNSITAFNYSVADPTPLTIQDNAVVETAGLLSYGPMKITGSGVQVTAQSSQGSSASTLQNEVGGITISGGAHVSASAYDKSAIYTVKEADDILISGAGTLVECVTNDDKSASIWSGGKVLIEDGAVVRASGPYFGIFSEASEPGAGAAMDDYPIQIVGAWVETVEKNTTTGVANSVLFEDGVGTTYGTASVMQDVEIPAGATLMVPADNSLTVMDGATLTNMGTLQVEGTLEVLGTGRFTGPASVSGEVYVFETDGGTNPADGAVLSLTDTGKVYSQRTELSGTTIQNASRSTGTYLHTSPFGSGEQTFINQWSLQNTPVDSGGSGGGSSSIPTYSVSLPDAVSGGKVTASKSYAQSGATVTLTVTPNDGYELDTLTVTDSKGNEVELVNEGNDQYTFKMPAGRVTINASFREIVVEPDPLPFADVAETAWYADAVRYVYENGLMNGVSDDLFAPNDTMNRAMLVTILHRQAGEPVVNYALPFDDVTEGTWYTEAVRWAASEGIVTGTTETAFAPDSPVTREQFATILYRYAQSKGQGFTGTWAFQLDYADADKVSEYAYEAMCWMTMQGVIEGDSANLNPQGQATRAEAAAMLMRFCEKLA